jgi:hypothetical protein
MAGRFKMGKMFGQKMKEYFNGLSEEDKKKMMSRFEKMAAMCPCMNMKDMTEDEKKAMMERMKSCCGEKMDMMSSFCK